MEKTYTQIENMVAKSKIKSYTEDLRVLNLIRVSKSLGYGVVKGLTDKYSVSYIEKGGTTYVYECDCPHNTHRGVPCKHMFKVGRQLGKKVKNIQLVSVAMEKNQTEKIFDMTTVNLVSLAGLMSTPSIGLSDLVSNLRTVENESKQGGVLYTHRVSNTGLDEVAMEMDCETETIVGGTNYTVSNSVDTVTLIIKGTKVIISGNNLVVNVE